MTSKYTPSGLFPKSVETTGLTVGTCSVRVAVVAQQVGGEVRAGALQDAVRLVPLHRRKSSPACFVLAPSCMYWLLVYVSGIPPLEEHMLRTRGDKFRAYQRRTNAFFPGPVRSGS